MHKRNRSFKIILTKTPFYIPRYYFGVTGFFLPSSSDVLLRFEIVLLLFSSKLDSKGCSITKPKFKNKRVPQGQPVQIYHFSTKETEARSLIYSKGKCQD